MNGLDTEIRDHLYNWLDTIPFSRPRKSLARFFADASSAAELINYFNPKFVYENAYPPCMSMASKIDNWERFNGKVLSKLGIKLTKSQIKNLANARLEYTEAFLCQLAAVLYRKNYFAIKRTVQDTELNYEEDDESSDKHADDSQETLHWWNSMEE